MTVFVLSGKVNEILPSSASSLVPSGITTSPDFTTVVSPFTANPVASDVFTSLAISSQWSFLSTSFSGL